MLTGLYLKIVGQLTCHSDLSKWLDGVPGTTLELPILERVVREKSPLSRFKQPRWIPNTRSVAHKTLAFLFNHLTVSNQVPGQRDTCRSIFRCKTTQSIFGVKQSTLKPSVRTNCRWSFNVHLGNRTLPFTVCPKRGLRGSAQLSITLYRIPLFDSVAVGIAYSWTPPPKKMQLWLN